MSPVIEWIDLLAGGIAGNSHALMAHDDIDDIATIVLDGSRQRGLAG